MIEAILPSTAAWSERFGDPPGTVLFAEEEALVARAVDKRRREFTSGRLCARAALTDLGFPAFPVLREEGRAPRWPSGIVGSITHCAGYTAATAGRRTELVTLGIDAERDDPLPEGVLGVIGRADEIDHVSELTRLRPHGPAWDRLLLCAKEAVFKAWFPLTRRWLGFEQAEVTVDPSTATFLARLLVRGPSANGQEIPVFAGRWMAQNDLILAAIAVPAGRG